LDDGLRRYDPALVLLPQQDVAGHRFPTVDEVSQLSSMARLLVRRSPRSHLLLGFVGVVLVLMVEVV
jgi:hypothetical protein